MATGATRESAPAAITGHGNPVTTSADSVDVLSRRSSTTAAKPNVPKRGSRIACAGSRPASEAPIPSPTSASPSRWSAAVTATPAAMPSTAATDAGSTWAEPQATSATRAPTTAPTAGNSAALRRRSRGPSSTARPTGTALRKESAARTGLIRSRIGGGRHWFDRGRGSTDAGGVERIHVGQDRDRRAHERERERRAGALAQAQSKVEQRFEPKVVEHQRVTGFGRAGGRDERGDGRLPEPDRDQPGRARDEPIEQDGDPARRGAKGHPDQERDLEAAHRRKHVGRIGVPAREPVRREPTANGVDLPREALIADPGSGAAHERRI